MARSHSHPAWLTPEFRAKMQLHIWALRDYGFTWQQISEITGLSRGTAHAIGDRPQLFRTVTRVTPAGEASVVRDA